jgi:AraC family L-rhamnose operon transcriptional activator RhaR/AraC family L-rhamnose operon regulatory protein RhaS
MFRTLKSADWFHADGFPVAIERREPQGPFPPHKHEFSEIVIVTGGKGVHVVGDESWFLGVGDVFVIGGPRIHKYGALEKLRLINILFQPEKLKFEPADLAELAGYHALFALEPGRRRHEFKNRLRLPPAGLGRLLDLVDQLDEELKNRPAGFGFMATALFMQIVGHLSRCYGHLRRDGPRNLTRVAEAISYLEANADKPTSLAQLAGVARMSKRSLIRAFHEATGVTPIAYWNQIRINRAAALLRSGAEPITEIAFRAGFNDSNYFTRQFRKLTGVSPRRYRQQHAAAGQVAKI